MTLADAPTLTTSRLVLRPPAAQDLPGFYAFGNDETAVRHLGGVKSRHEIWRAVCGLAGAWVMDGFGMFSVLKRDTGEWIGRVGPWCPEGWPVREVGYGLLTEQTGRGYATEAASACIDYAFDVLGWESVHHVIAPDNAGSLAVAARLGARYTGEVTLPPPYQNVAVDAYGQTKAEWRARKKAAS